MRLSVADIRAAMNALRALKFDCPCGNAATWVRLDGDVTSIRCDAHKGWRPQVAYQVAEIDEGEKHRASIDAEWVGN